jgi:hypothetical protein
MSGERTPCFWLEPIPRVRRALRRFVFSSEAEPCPLKAGYHNALAPIDEVDHPLDARITITDAFANDDPRWPTACACGYAFVDADHRQLFVDRLYRRSDTGRETTLDEAPPGAMWDGEPDPEHAKNMTGPDGISLVVKLPDGSAWCVDGTSSSGGRWTRHGKPPKVTALPSVDTGRWHGHLISGHLVSV